MVVYSWWDLISLCTQFDLWLYPFCFLCIFVVSDVAAEYSLPVIFSWKSVWVDVTRYLLNIYIYMCVCLCVSTIYIYIHDCYIHNTLNRFIRLYLVLIRLKLAFNSYFRFLRVKVISYWVGGVGDEDRAVGADWLCDVWWSSDVDSLFMLLAAYQENIYRPWIGCPNWSRVISRVYISVFVSFYIYIYCSRISRKYIIPSFLLILVINIYIFVFLYIVSFWVLWFLW